MFQLRETSELENSEGSRSYPLTLGLESIELLKSASLTGRYASLGLHLASSSACTVAQCMLSSQAG